MSYNMYCREKIHCPCCDRKIVYFNLGLHQASYPHLKNLPEKDDKFKRSVEDREANKKLRKNCIEIDKINKQWDSGQITEKEYELKLKDYGIDDFKLFCFHANIKLKYNKKNVI